MEEDLLLQDDVRWLHQKMQMEPLLGHNLAILCSLYLTLG